MHWPPLPPGNVPGTHFHYRLSRPQGYGTVGRNMSPKNPVTPPGIDPGTVRLVAQCLNHYATPDPRYQKYKDKRTITDSNRVIIQLGTQVIPETAYSLLIRC
jgi:hypothetical protein